MKIISIVGARPEFIQASPVSHALRRHHHEILVHTGQHYDYQMSQAFFTELNIPIPDYNLEVGSDTHARQTGKLLICLDDVFQKEKPDLVIVRGDTNSTLAGALAASKLNIPTAHLESGERSFNRKMPEEINRIIVDAVSDLHFCSSSTAIDHLKKEGISSNVHWVGDPMYDAMLQNWPIAQHKSHIIETLKLISKHYALVTIHRSATTDDPQNLAKVVSILSQVGEEVVFPVHPRTRLALDRLNAHFSNSVHLIEPVGYYDMMMLEENARLIATDSGGVQREAYFMGIPCLTLRDETEWNETVKAGWNKLVGIQPEIVLKEWSTFSPRQARPKIFGDGHASQKIADIIGGNESTIKKTQEMAVSGIL
jgi:UDP-N-acetylglucosamine 2-epimerase